MKSKILENVKTFREKANFSQDEISVKMNITQSKYARFERGATKTDLDILLSFCKATNRSLIELITHPDTYINVSDITALKEEERVSLTIELKKDKKEQVLKLIFGDNNLEIFNR